MKRVISPEMRRGFWLVGSLVLLWVGLSLGVPWAVRYILEGKLPEHLGQQISVGKIRFSPLRFSLEIQDFVLGQPEDPGIRMGRVGLDIGVVRSLFSRQLVISSLDVENPAFHIRLEADGRLNFGGIPFPEEQGQSDGEVEKKGEETSGKPFPFLIQKMDLRGGNVHFQDAGRDFSESLTDMRLRALLLGTAPDRKGRFWGGWRLEKGGTCSLDLSLGLNPFFVKGHVGAGGIPLPLFEPYFPGIFDGYLASGLFSMGADLLFADGDFSVPHLKGHLSDLNILHGDHTPFFSMETLRFSGGPLRPLAQDYRMETILFEKPKFHVERTETGIRLPFLEAYEAGTQDVKGKEETEVASVAMEAAREGEALSLLSWNLDHLLLEEGEIFWHDPLIAGMGDGGFRGKVQGVHLEGYSFASGEGHRGRLRGGLNLESGGRLIWHMDLGLTPLSAKGHIRLDRLQLPVFAPYFPEQFDGKLTSGAFTLSGDFLLDGKDFSIPQLEGELSALEVRFTGGEPFFKMEKLAVVAGPLEPLKNTWHVKKVQLLQPEFYAERTAEGIRLPFAMTIQDGKAEPDSGLPSDSEAKGEKISDLSFSLGHFSLSDGKVRYRDSLLEEEARLRLDALYLDINDLVLPGKIPFPWRFSARLDGEGEIRSEGTCLQEPISILADFALEKIALKAASPYLKKYAGLVLPKGEFRLVGGLGWDTSEGLRIQADMGVSDLSLRRSDERDAFLQMGVLDIHGIEMRENPPVIAMKEGFLREAKFLLDYDPEGIRPFVTLSPSGDSEDTGGGEEEKEPEDAGETFRFRMDTFRMENNRFSFYDRSVNPLFHTEISAVSGVFQDVDTGDAQKKFGLEMTALKDGQSPVFLSLKGRMPDFLDETTLDFRIEDVEMAGLSSYARTYAGYPLERGKMRVDLDWRVRENYLDTRNHLHLKGLRLGTRIPDSDAPNIPLGLAQALLEDRHGVIQIDLPVTGDVTDPQFRIGPTLWRAFTGLIMRMATSPFTALLHLGGEENSPEVLFLPGSSVLEPQHIEKLRILGRSLRERPLLQLEMMPVTGDADRQALAAVRVEAEIAGKMAKGMDREAALVSLHMEKTGGEPESLERALETLLRLEPVDEGLWLGLERERILSVRRVLVEEENIEVSRLFRHEGRVDGPPAVKFSLTVK